MKAGRFLGMFLFWLALPALAGEPLVKKNPDGTFAPGLVVQWQKAGKNIRLLLAEGIKAQEAVKELAAQLAPWKLKAADDVTIVVQGKKLKLEALLEKLSQLTLASAPAPKPQGDSLAALVALGKDGEPALSDLSSDSSIRASKKIPLPGGEKAPWGPEQLAGKVLSLCPCEPLPTIEIELLAAPSVGEHKDAFQPGQKIMVRGFYQIDDQTKQIVRDEARTSKNLQSASLKPGDVIYGKPFLKDKEVWVLETIEKK